MVYSTSRCPACKKIVGKETNPSYKIGNPFEKCPWCGKVYRNQFKEEWITKSPLKRFFFFLQIGVWARAFLIPFIALSVLGASPDTLWTLLPLASIWWIIGGYFFHKRRNKKHIEESLIRTQDAEYLKLLKASGYTIYPVDTIDNEEQSAKPAEKDKSEKIIMQKKVEAERIYNRASDCRCDFDNNDDIERLLEKAEMLENNGETKKAVDLYRAAATLGSDEAYMSLGCIFYYGKNDIEINVEEALKCFACASELGNKYAERLINEAKTQKNKIECVRCHHVNFSYAQVCAFCGRRMKKASDIRLGTLESDSTCKFGELKSGKLMCDGEHVESGKIANSPNKNVRQETKKCFLCGREINDFDEQCSHCGAKQKQIETSDTGNPHTKRYLLSDGTQIESNLWQILGSAALICGVAISLYFLVFAFDLEALLGGIVIISIGILSIVMGSYLEKIGRKNKK